MQPGDCIILNAANSTVGQFILQLCRLLHLRSIAVVRQHEQTQQDFDDTSAWLKSLGADVVLEDFGSLKVRHRQAAYQLSFDARINESTSHSTRASLCIAHKHYVLGICTAFKSIT